MKAAATSHKAKRKMNTAGHIFGEKYGDDAMVQELDSMKIAGLCGDSRVKALNSQSGDHIVIRSTRSLSDV